MPPQALPLLLCRCLLFGLFDTHTDELPAHLGGTLAQQLHGGLLVGKVVASTVFVGFVEVIPKLETPDLLVALKNELGVGKRRDLRRLVFFGK